MFMILHAATILYDKAATYLPQYKFGLLSGFYLLNLIDV